MILIGIKKKNYQRAGFPNQRVATANNCEKSDEISFDDAPQ
jgi:hypothetical protein